MNVLISGASGFVGSALGKYLSDKGMTVKALPRNATDGALLEGYDAVVHLAGENIAAGRWTAAKKQRIRDSRVVGTRRLCEAIAQLKSPPSVVVSASAIGFYGDRGEEILSESSTRGDLFLSEVCEGWENATAPLVEKRIRVVNPRIGMVLDGRGGALTKMLLPFKLGLGGIIGSGRQFMSWITLEDLLRVIERAITSADLNGPVNAVSPHPVTNREFTSALGRALHRPTLFPMPAFAARLVFGQMADELLLASTRVEPTVLKKTGFSFAHPDIDSALQSSLNSR